jgi:hypothetical protein
MAKELDPLKLSSPRIFLLRMLVFVVLGGLVAFLLYKQIEVAFMANPGLNSLIIGSRSNGRRCCWRRWRRSSAAAWAAWRCRRK